MSRLPMVSEDPTDPKLRELFRELRGRGIEVSNLYRTLGNAPAMLRAWLDFAWPLRLDATTPRALRELVILRGATASRTEYEWVHHVKMAAAAGVSPERIEAVKAWQRSPLFTAAERASLRLADEVTLGDGASEDCIAQLRGHFSDSEVTELLLTACFYVCVSRFLKSAGVELEAGSGMSR